MLFILSKFVISTKKQEQHDLSVVPLEILDNISILIHIRINHKKT
jgi:hypothetical protein